MQWHRSYDLELGNCTNDVLEVKCATHPYVLLRRLKRVHGLTKLHGRETCRFMTVAKRTDAQEPVWAIEDIGFAQRSHNHMPPYERLSLDEEKRLWCELPLDERLRISGVAKTSAAPRDTLPEPEIKRMQELRPVTAAAQPFTEFLCRIAPGFEALQPKFTSVGIDPTTQLSDVVDLSDKDLLEGTEKAELTPLDQITFIAAVRDVRSKMQANPGLQTLPMPDLMRDEDWQIVWRKLEATLT